MAAAGAATEFIRQVSDATCAPLRAPILELRLDFLPDRTEIARFLRWLGREPRLPALIATCRRREAGGNFAGDIAEELAILTEAVTAGCDWCDVEIETAQRVGSRGLKSALAPARLLISAHDFRLLPRNLPAVVQRLEAYGGDAVKIAAAVRSFSEVIPLLELAHNHGSRVVIPMGEDMIGPRLLALRHGSALAYAPVARNTAPGQIAFTELQRVYKLRRSFGRFDAGPNRQTKLYGVIGDPVGHSLSPLMHNTAFAVRRKNALYVPFHVRNLRDFIEAIEPLAITGFSVTIPHKQSILRYLDHCDPLAAEIGAVNTVLVRGGKLYGYNTDFIGVLRAIERRLPLASSRVLLIGAGGAARAAAFALARSGAAVSIWARRPAQSAALARAVGGEAIDREQIARQSFDAIVNCTPVGMHPGRGSPLEARELNCRLVMDLIYRPLQTELLRRAERRGMETISGADMFVAQGVAQWELWTRERAPERVMRQVVLDELRNERKSPDPDRAIIKR